MGALYWKHILIEGSLSQSEEEEGIEKWAYERVIMLEYSYL